MYFFSGFLGIVCLLVGVPLFIIGLLVIPPLVLAGLFLCAIAAWAFRRRRRKESPRDAQTREELRAIGAHYQSHWLYKPLPPMTAVPQYHPGMTPDRAPRPGRHRRTRGSTRGQQADLTIWDDPDTATAMDDPNEELY